MVKITAALALCSLLILSACGNEGQKDQKAVPPAQTSEVHKNNSSGTTTNGTTGTQTDGSGSENSPETNKNQTNNDQTNQGSASKPDSKDQQPSTKAVTVQYRMNKAYDIVPSVEGIPKKVVLLTFDDGPKKAEMINGLIDTLDKHHAKAIFFVNGYRVKQHPELLKLIAERGQTIGNHSWDHIILKNKPEAEVRRQIEDTQQIVKATVGKAPVFFRPPNGAGGDTGKKIAKENGLLYMTWSNGSLDWTMSSKSSSNADKVVSNVLDQLHSGSNILMHELPWTVEALDTLLTKLESKGYTFVDPESIDTQIK
ncbi:MULTISPECIES: polysaccharide deacetylase family protein [Paenibacillus]|uniref:polysaccharide deacetylase family protein n=1 Tax=Paenibacillus TaxID=44249 RepID=UPI0011A5744D|nr:MULTISPECIES: polysaccharide deacetylase family protein [Paenibacillus]MBJ9988466.1 polysaccharide deacetylase family protein [Paenibacillus sp. S28]